ncbi:DNA-3-methyladenine glycosylase [Criblamydia sequanensis CRIB-18]|uniref:Putative 3-methyladenine DNA glycosylase n=2 Tax=Candidatus Criblamydia sequanensis TaxID=340071 RepID=A0A090D392_9BACT|nr:DNA-3-methyladenine glycosylase [Criblamydia sequanensis CRIB-18]
MLNEDFYLHDDVLFLAEKLIGKTLFTNIGGKLTAGIIVETEAYKAPEDKASHAYNLIRTKRNESMYRKGGTAYVYLCYGIHTMFNIVTNKEEMPHAILIRAIEPTLGIEVMLERRKKMNLTPSLTMGPGALTQALGITLKQDKVPLFGPEIWIEKEKKIIPSDAIDKSKRIGIDYAEEYKEMLWRFTLKNSPYIRKEKRVKE